VPTLGIKLQTCTRTSLENLHKRYDDIKHCLAEKYCKKVNKTHRKHWRCMRFHLALPASPIADSEEE